MPKKVLLAVLVLSICAPVLADESGDFISQLPKDSEVRKACDACEGLWSITGALEWLKGSDKNSRRVACKQLNENIQGIEKTANVMEGYCRLFALGQYFFGNSRAGSFGEVLFRQYLDYEKLKSVANMPLNPSRKEKESDYMYRLAAYAQNAKSLCDSILGGEEGKGNDDYEALLDMAIASFKEKRQ